jgi:CRP-like cAMP-binding protein
MFAQAIERNAFLSELSAAEAAILRTHLVPFELRVGDRLHRVGAMVENVVFPHSGLVAVIMPLRGNIGAAAALIGRDGMVGAIAAAAAVSATADADVQIAGQASRMSAMAFRYVLDQSPTIRRRVARFTSAMLSYAQQTALCHANHPVEARICRWLLEVLDRSGSPKVPLTQSTLAQMLGVRRTTVTLVAGRLEAAGLLNCRRGYMQIVAREQLEKHSCECYAHLRDQTAYLRAPPSEATTAADAANRDRPGRRVL